MTNFQDAMDWCEADPGQRTWVIRKSSVSPWYVVAIRSYGSKPGGEYPDSIVERSDELTMAMCKANDRLLRGEWEKE